jgi:hypothetical protein
MILKKDSGDEHKFCATLMEKTVGGIGILNSDLFSDQFFLQCRYTELLLRLHVKISSCYTIGLSLYGVRHRRITLSSLHIRVFLWRGWKGELAINFDFVYTSLAINSSCFAGFQNSNLICSCFFCSSFFAC